MAIIENAEIWFARLDPDRPSKTIHPENPTWEVQIRTTDKAVRKQWLELKLNVRAKREDDQDEESTLLYYYCNLKKHSIAKDGKKAQPVQVIDGRGKDLDPNTIGHGTIANLRIFQTPYSFTPKDGGKTLEGIASILMAVQVVKLKLYEAGPREDFKTEFDTEVVAPTPKAPEGAPVVDETGVY